MELGWDERVFGCRLNCVVGGRPRVRELFGCDSLNILLHVRPDDEGPLHHWEVLDPAVATKGQSKHFGFSEITKIISSCRHFVENYVQSPETSLFANQ